MFTTVIRTFIMYAVIIIAIRVMGKRQIGDLQPSDLVITILISEIAAVPIQDTEIPLYIGVIATVTLVILEIITSYLAMKFINIRKMIYGTSALIINNGVINQQMLRKLRVTGPDLIEVLRNQEVFDITQVEYAILETNGQISVLLKQEYQTASVNDLNGIKTESTLPYLIISDGKLLKHTVKDVGLNDRIVKQEISRQGLNIKDIFLMTYDEQGTYNIVKKQK